jgi:hypothetical protein
MTAGPAPTLMILLELESKAPRVVVGFNNDGEEHRLADWIQSQDGLADLVARALELAEEEQAA